MSPKALKGPYLCLVHGRCHGCAASSKPKTTKAHTHGMGEAMAEYFRTKMIFDRDMMGMPILRVVPCSTT